MPAPIMPPMPSCTRCLAVSTRLRLASPDGEPSAENGFVMNRLLRFTGESLVDLDPATTNPARARMHASEQRADAYPCSCRTAHHHSTSSVRDALDLPVTSSPSFPAPQTSMETYRAENLWCADFRSYPQSHRRRAHEGPASRSHPRGAGDSR